MSKRFGLRHYAGLTTFVACLAALVVVPLALAGAINTSTDPGQLVGSATTLDCLNGPTPSVNCNLYQQKEDVFLSGSPVAAALGTGTYYFAVLNPGGQPDPNPGADDLLSSDAAAQREFSITDGSGTISNGGDHLLDGKKLSVYPYEDTANNGGVYILAVCKLSDTIGAYTDTPSVTAGACKYDAFKVQDSVPPPPCDPPTPECQPPPAADLVVTKDANPSFTRDYDWSVAKHQTTSSNAINASGSTTSVSYQVKASWSGPTDSGWQVGGTISVLNPNTGDASTVSVADAITDPSANPAGSCNVGDQDPNVVTDVSTYDIGTLAGNASTEVTYVCTFSSKPTYSADYTNTATASWNTILSDNSVTLDGAASFSVPFQFDDGVVGNPTVTHDTSTITDTFNATSTTLGVAKIDGTFTKDGGNTLWPNSQNSSIPAYDGTTNTFTFTYARAVTVVVNQCTTYNNTATVTDGDTNPDNTATASVTVCGKITGGLTIGFWSNNNGRAVLCATGHDPKWRQLLNGTDGSAPYNGGNYLRIANGNKYAVPATGTCTTADANFAKWLLSATATNMSYMLSAQLAATILDVNFNGMNGGACIGGTDGNPTTISSLIANAIAFLTNDANKNTTASGPARTLATAYKNIFDNLNNGKVFAVPGCV